MNAQQAIKRLIDVSLSALILAAAFPVMAVAAALVLLLEGRPVFYVSRRCVSVGRTVPVYKFRTMVRDATSDRYRLKERFMRDGYLDIPPSCEVYTPIGRVLERLQIVELPQLLNVLFHGMSLIGNRPLPAENLQYLMNRREWRKRFDSPAGITGIAQVVGRRELTPGQRFDLECAYSRRYREGDVAWCDLKIFFYTLYVILFSKGIPLEEAYRLVGAELKISEIRPISQTIAQP